MDIRETFMKEVGFLKWARIDADDVATISYHDGPVFISPDVNSLHIAWQSDANEWQHEITDYSKHGSVIELLENEIGDDAWDTFDEYDIYDTLGDYGEYTEETMPVVTLAQLKAQEAKS